MFAFFSEFQYILIRMYRNKLQNMPVLTSKDDVPRSRSGSYTFSTLSSSSEFSDQTYTPTQESSTETVGSNLPDNQKLLGKINNTVIMVKMLHCSQHVLVN